MGCREKVQEIFNLSLISTKEGAVTDGEGSLLYLCCSLPDMTLSVCILCLIQLRAVGRKPDTLPREVLFTNTGQTRSGLAVSTMLWLVSKSF